MMYFQVKILRRYGYRRACVSTDVDEGSGLTLWSSIWPTKLSK